MDMDIYIYRYGYIYMYLLCRGLHTTGLNKTAFCGFISLISM